MPTIHVTPGTDLHLQDIANTLFKAKKVVVVTGAGISTNSGIPDFRSENGLYSLIQAQFEAASRELDRREEEREQQEDRSDSDAPSSPPVIDPVDARPAKRRKLSIQEEIAVRSVPVAEAEVGQTNEPATLEETYLNPRHTQSPAQDEDGVVCSGETTSIVVALSDGGRSIRVASEGLGGLEDSIVVLSGGVTDHEHSGTKPESPCGPLGSASEETSCPGPELGGADSTRTGVTLHSASESPRLLPRRPKDNPTSQTQHQHLESSISELLNDLQSSSQPSTPIFSHLSSELDHHNSHPLSSSPLSSPPPILSDPYESCSLERTYSRSDSCSSSSSSSDTEATDATDQGSGSSTPFLASQSSFNSSQSRSTALPNLKGRDLFDASIWADPVKTSVFYTFATTLRQKARDVSPTTSHLFLSVLRDQRKLVRCYTQNIDRLEDRIGLSTCLELGAGSRARFSAKAWRKPVAGGQGQGPGQKGDRMLQPTQEQVGLGHRDASGEATIDAASRADDARGERQEDSPQVLHGHGVLRDSCKESCLEQNRECSCDQPGCQRSKQQWQSNPQARSPTSGSAEPGDAPSTLSTPSGGVECVFLHGSLESLRCFLCGQTCSWDDSERELETLAGRQPTCPHCAGATAAREERGKRALGVGKLRPDIVLYGEEHPRSDLIGSIVQHDLSLGPDMLLILGTSLRVHGLKTVVREFAKAVHSKGGKVVFVNFTKPPDSVWSDVIDFWVQSDCDAWVSDIKARKPALWLPPGTVVDEGQKPSKPKRMSNGGSAALRRSSAGLSRGPDKDSMKVAKAKRKTNDHSTKLRQDENTNCSKPTSDASPDASYTYQPTEAQLEGIVQPAAEGCSQGQNNVAPCTSAQQDEAKASNNVTEIVVYEQQATATKRLSTARKPRRSLPSGPDTRPAPRKEGILNPNAKRPQSIRDEVFNGAHLSWKILESLKRLTGEPKPVFLFTRQTKSEPKTARSRKPRQSAPAVFSSVPDISSHPSSWVVSTGQPHNVINGSAFPPLVSHKTMPLPFDPVYQCAAGRFSQSITPFTPPGSGSPPAMSFPSWEQSVLHSFPRGSSPISGSPRQVEEAPDEFSKERRQSAEETLSGERGNTNKSAAVIPSRKVAPHPDPPLEIRNPPISPPSIGAAIKVNPRKRKRKTIDGVEVVLPNKGRRAAPSRPSLPNLTSRGENRPPQTPSSTVLPSVQADSHPEFAPGPLPVPRKSLSPATPLTLAREDTGEQIQLAPIMGSISPTSLKVMEPAPMFSHVNSGLPASNGHHKLVSFFSHHPQSGLTTPFHNLSLETSLWSNPFKLRNPLVALPYNTPPLIDRRDTPATPSEQLHSEEEAALSLSMLHNAPRPAAGLRYLAAKKTEWRGFRSNGEDGRSGEQWVREDMSSYYAGCIGIR